MPILFSMYHIYIYIYSTVLPPFRYIQELMTRSHQRPSRLSWQSVALDSRGRDFDSHRRPWSCIFRKWSRLSLRKFTQSQNILIVYLYHYTILFFIDYFLVQVFLYCNQHSLFMQLNYNIATCIVKFINSNDIVCFYIFRIYFHSG